MQVHGLYFNLLMHCGALALQTLSHSSLHPLSPFVVREYILHIAASWPEVGTASHPLNLIGHPRCHPQNSQTHSHVRGRAMKQAFLFTPLHIQKHGPQSAICAAPFTESRKVLSTLSYICG